jgi:valyl-tRNA synthetase
LLGEHQDDICVKQFPAIQNASSEILAQGDLLKRVITGVRDARNKNNIKPRETITLYVHSENDGSYKTFEPLLRKQVNAKEFFYTTESVSGAVIVAVEKDKFFIEAEQETDTSGLKAGLEKDLAYQRNFLTSVQKKLSNKRFVENAKPEVVELEKKKQADAEARIKTIEESLQNLD